MLILAGLALAGLSGATAHADRLSPAARRAVGYLERAQDRDGGFGASPRAPSAELFSGWVALGLAAAGVDVATLRVAPGRPTLLAYLRRDTATDPGSLERTMLALAAAGDLTDARVRAARIMRRFSTAGTIDRQVNLTAFGVLALRAAGAPGAAAVERRAVDWLLGQADGDGGFGWAGRGSGSDADDTGAVLQALGGVEGARVALVRRRAVAYLRHDQDRDGGFPSQPGAGSDAQSTAWAVQGLIAAGVAPATLRRDGPTPLGYLRALVGRTGAVAYARGESVTPVWVTAQALPALTATALPVAPFVVHRRM